MKFTFEVSRIEFEFYNGMGRSDELDALESISSAEYNEEYRKKFPKTIEAYDERDARGALAREIERETGWCVRKVQAEVVRVEP